MKDAVIYYGDSTQVNAIDHKNYGEFLKHTEKKQELPGFDAEYLDIVDYILKITIEFGRKRELVSFMIPMPTTAWFMQVTEHQPVYLVL